MFAPVDAYNLYLLLIVIFLHLGAKYYLTWITISMYTYASFNECMYSDYWLNHSKTDSDLARALKLTDLHANSFSKLISDDLIALTIIPIAIGLQVLIKVL